MTRSKLIDSPEIAITSNLDISTWLKVDVETINNSHIKEKFLKRKQAVEMYMLNAASIKQIEQLTGINRKELGRLLKRCIELDSFGTVWGFRALIPNKKLKNYTRFISANNSHNHLPTNFSGSFKQLLKAYPKIQEIVIDSFLSQRKKAVAEPIISIKFIHKRFLDACRAEGITVANYPFNTLNAGRKSIERYVKELENTYFANAAARYGEDSGRIASTTGLGEQNNQNISRPFQRVQFDGHRIDAMAAITFTTPEGDEITNVIERIWLLTIIDVATRAILGYHLSLNKEYSSWDVLQCVKNAVEPWKPKTLTIPGLKYPEKGGFASGKIDVVKWALWDELLYDNGKANLANIVKDRLTEVVKCAVNAGPVKTPERRGLIERFFGILEENGYHRLPSTTGSNPKDPKRQNPEKKAIEYKIKVEHLFELTEVLIAEYNGTPHGGVYYFTPLEIMEQRIQRGMELRTMLEEKRSDINFFNMRVTRDVAGSVKRGKRPYVQYENVEYRSDVLARTPELIGTKLTLLVNINDLRSLHAYLPDGSEFGMLTAHGKWGITPHTLETRKRIFDLKRRKLIHFTYYDDPIIIYLDYLESEAQTSKRARNQWAGTKRYMNDENQKKQHNSSSTEESKKSEKNTKQINKSVKVSVNRKLTKTYCL